MKQIIQRTYYETIDGRQFENKHEAEKHEKKLEFFELYCFPDTTEGRHSCLLKGYIAVAANDRHSYFAEYAAHKVLGNRITFCQGVFGSNAIMENWKIKHVDKDNVLHNEKTPVLITVKDNFCEFDFKSEINILTDIFS